MFPWFPLLKSAMNSVSMHFLQNIRTYIADEPYFRGSLKPFSYFEKLVTKYRKKLKLVRFAKSTQSMNIIDNWVKIL